MSSFPVQITLGFSSVHEAAEYLRLHDQSVPISGVEVAPKPNGAATGAVAVPQPAAGPSVDDMRLKARELSTAYLRAPGKDAGTFKVLLAKFGATKVPEVPPEQLPAFLAELAKEIPANAA